MIVAIVPFKRLTDAKSRLAPGLSRQERARLALSLLSRVLAALRESGVIDRIAIVTPEEDLRIDVDVARLEDRGSLNASLRSGIEWALALQANSALILPADLPLVRPGDVCDLVAHGAPSPSITIVGTQDGGTGALLLSPPNALAPAFGPQSFAAHVAAGNADGIAVHEAHIEGLSLDLDTIGDLREAQLRGKA